MNSQIYDLTGKTALITGASRGIGASIALALANSGCKVIAHYGSYPEGATENLKEIAESKKAFIHADLSQRNSGRELFRKVISNGEKIDIFINNAAVHIETPFEGDDFTWDSGWDKTLQINVIEAGNLIRESVNHFLANGGGTLISLSSWSGQRGSALSTLPAYAASKAAIKAMTQTVAQNYAKQGILAYVIAPGIVKTRMSEQAAKLRGGEEKMKSNLVMGELVPPEEIANLAVMLASGNCRHLTGSTLDINGASYVR